MENKDIHGTPDRVDRVDAVEADKDRSHRDPITGEPGAHPLGTGIGAAATGAVATAIGATAGPVGAVVGAVVGSVVGGLVGKGAAEAVNPTAEDDYWRSNYTSRPYVKSGRTYEEYQPAYRTGYEGYGRYADSDRTYDDIEPELRQDYERNHVGAPLAWDDAKYATRDAYDRAMWQGRLRDEDSYWQTSYTSRPYYDRNLTYDDYSPAYRMGYEGYGRYAATGRTFDEAEPELRRDYERQHGGGRLAWEKAKFAVRDAWDRVAQGHRR